MSTFHHFPRAVSSISALQVSIDEADREVEEIDRELSRLQARRDDVMRERAALTAGAADIGHRVGLITIRQAAE
ncbi:MAG: hypothetical protein J0I98_14360 [Mesorhizobium sp.]|nr:hypothetical protein [Mesorhizobium sp.]MBN9243971.1 hypothetical protein [Mesorhizobium sp.]MBN9274225.1 hypothetical protein [Mesorhizobium sp.]